MAPTAQSSKDDDFLTLLEEDATAVAILASIIVGIAIIAIYVVFYPIIRLLDVLPRNGLIGTLSLIFWVSAIGYVVYLIKTESFDGPDIHDPPITRTADRVIPGYTPPEDRSQGSSARQSKIPDKNQRLAASAKRLESGFDRLFELMEQFAEDSSEMEQLLKSCIDDQQKVEPALKSQADLRDLFSDLASQHSQVRGETNHFLSSGGELDYDLEEILNISSQFNQLSKRILNQFDRVLIEFTTYDSTDQLRESNYDLEEGRIKRPADWPGKDEFEWFTKFNEEAQTQADQLNERLNQQLAD